jgi:DNA polymerase-1
MSRWGYANTAHKWLNIPDEECGRYNMHDVYWTGRLLKPLLSDARALGQLGWWSAHGAPFQRAVLDMSNRGILLNSLALAEYRQKVSDELVETDTRIRAAADAAGFPYTSTFPNSRDQVSQFLFDWLELKPTKRTAGKGRGSVDQEALTQVLRDFRKKDEPHRPLLFDLFHRTRIHTILTRYLNLDPDDDGRIRPIIKLAHVKTWRLAYAHPALQQYPEEARHIFRAKPGHLLLSADYDQLEARILSYYSDDKPSIEVFEAGGDPHAANARDLFNLTEADWTALEDRSSHRGYAKTWLYRRMYGGTAASGDKKLFCPCPKCAATMPSTLALKPAEAAKNEERWDARHPNVKRWQAAIASEVRATHRFPLLLGGYRYMAAPWSRDLARELKNAPMQSGGARVMIRAQNQLYAAGAPIVLQHHDSFLLEIPEAEAKRWAATVRTAMESPVTIGTHEVRLPVSMKLGRNWGRYHPEKNPGGLRNLP